MKRFMIWKWWWGVAVTLSLATPAMAVDPAAYPLALHLAGCVDLFDTVTAGSVENQVQTTGSPDGQCDYDKRVKEDANSASQLYGPISRAQLGNPHAIRVRAFRSDAGGGQWLLTVSYVSPIDRDAAPILLDTSAAATGSVVNVVDIGVDAASLASSSTDIMAVDGLPDVFYLTILLTSATAWDGSLVIIPLYH